MMVGLVFFFSSRRRHTRYWRDWSSDVCSSDLVVSVCAERAAGPVDSLTGLVATRDVAADAAVGVQDRGVVATAEVTTDRGGALVGHLAREVHGDLAGPRDLRPAVVGYEGVGGGFERSGGRGPDFRQAR